LVEASLMRTFYLLRQEDISGVSGTGRVAEGVQFSDGYCCIRWVVGAYHSVEVWSDIEGALAVHGHGGRTTVEWVG
jgi:hypothetical protein